MSHIIVSSVLKRSILKQFRGFSSFSRSSKPLNEKITIKVPTMGDSISEGTIVEWSVAVGQAVKVDDLIALVETDKVTIDMKASVDGVITQHFAQVDDTVEVGAPLYEIDTEAAPSIEWTGCAASGTADEETASAETDESVTISSTSGEQKPETLRRPSIHFLGKEGWKKKLSAEGKVLEQKPLQPLKPHGLVVLDGSNIRKSSYGRIVISQKEMDAFLLGGANVAPGFSD
jgi:pyruvate/2-oxoglutarate dehydrogenase complex dihydrolipoamide acyltransferase (E2) component